MQQGWAGQHILTGRHISRRLIARARMPAGPPVWSDGLMQGRGASHKQCAELAARNSRTRLRQSVQYRRCSRRKRKGIKFDMRAVFYATGTKRQITARVQLGHTCSAASPRLLVLLNDHHPSRNAAPRHICHSPSASLEMPVVPPSRSRNPLSSSTSRYLHLPLCSFPCLCRPQHRRPEIALL